MESTMERICPACGEKVSENALFCSKCGTKITGGIGNSEGENADTESIAAGNADMESTAAENGDMEKEAAENAAAENMENQNIMEEGAVKEEKSDEAQKSNKKGIIIGAVSVAAVILLALIVNTIQASNLKKELLRDWRVYEKSGSSYVELILDFSENEIDYRIETGYSWIDTTIATIEYKVISGNKIKVKRYDDEWETIEIEFDDDKSVMRVSPAITEAKSEEYWHCAD